MNKSVVRVFVFSIIVVLIGVLYFEIVLPFLNLMNNEVKSQGNHGPIVDNNGVFDKDFFPNRTADATPSTPKPGEQGTFHEVEAVRELALDKGAKNILLLGFDENSYLVDTIIVLSINTSTKVIKMVSLPRDTFVPYSDEVVQAIINHKPDGRNSYFTAKGAFKLNAVPYVGDFVVNTGSGKFENQGINLLCTTVSQLMGASYNYKIDDYIRINFEGFMEIVDILGGITVTVPQNFYNEKGELMLAEGKQTLNAKQALYYVRVRYLYDEHGNHVESSGDYFRKVNQLNLLMEISKQIITPDNILNANSILNSLTSNVKHSIAFSDLSEYLKIAQEFLGDTYSIEPYLLTGDAIDPFHDDASYVDIAFVGEEKINALVRRWQALARSSGVL